MPNNKNHHYIPQFYLKNFSFENNSSEIGMFNTNSKVFKQAVPIKSQASKDYYYGKDSKTEEWLSDYENKVAITYKNILNVENGYKLTSQDIEILKEFTILTEQRNPIRINHFKNIGKNSANLFKDIAPKTDMNEFMPKINHEDAVSFYLDDLNKFVELIADLKYAIFINKTNIPFITSDYPVVHYNQFLENSDYSRGKSGYVSLGLQIFFPLNPKLLLLLYDGSVYNVGKSKQKYVELNQVSDINQINLLQMLNNSQNVFFNHDISANYVIKIFKKSKKYQKAHSDETKIVAKKIDEDGLERYLLHTKNIALEINLKINQIKIKPKAKRFKLGNWELALERPIEKYVN